MILQVEDIWDDAQRVLGTCDQEVVYSRINDAIELLANKGEWEPLLAYLDVTATDRVVPLPIEVETPLAVSLNGDPAIGRDKLFEFHVNGPGDHWDESDWRWQDGFRHATLVDPSSTDPETVGVYSTDGTDTGGFVTIFGQDENGDPLTTDGEPGLIMGLEGGEATVFSVQKPSRIDAIKKGTTNGNVFVVTSGGTVYAKLRPQDTTSQYRRILVSKPDAAVRIFFRRTTAKVAFRTDWIPLNQRFALVLALRAIKAYDDERLDVAMAYEAQAARLVAEKNYRLQPPVGMPIQIEVAGTLGQDVGELF